MAENSKIEWTHHTFNPWIGCTKVSPGCDHCYAEGTAGRFKLAEWGAGKPRRLSSDEYWKQPLAWNRKAEKAGERHRVFCASLADVFDNEVPEEWRVRLWQLIYDTPHLDWLLLTKRIGNAKHMLPMGAYRDGALPNLWLGISVVNQEEADRDIPKLMTLPVRVRFLSMEPLLGSVNISQHLPHHHPDNDPAHPATRAVIKAAAAQYGYGVVDWVIVGGESGHHARAVHPEWVRSLRDQCAAAGVPFFFKQWGEWQPLSTTSGKQELPFGEYVLPSSENNGFGFLKKGKTASGRLLDGSLHDDYPS